MRPSPSALLFSVFLILQLPADPIKVDLVCVVSVCKRESNDVVRLPHQLPVEQFRKLRLLTVDRDLRSEVSIAVSEERRPAGGANTAEALPCGEQVVQCDLLRFSHVVDHDVQRA